ncbi:MAG: helix-turn-helix domain-containing protein [Tannerellaceae bacterium]|jgi:AraC-like DNA-binding protein|nr:helix-turn-helix domain-containing protein [Tannerellaceae bacterium]
MNELNEVSDHPDIISLQQKCAVGYIFLMISNILISIGMAWPLFVGNPAFRIFMCVLLAVHLYCLYYVYRQPLYKWRTLAVALILCVMIALIPIIIVAHTLGNVTPYFWMIVPPLAYYIIYPTAKMSNIVIFFGCIIFLIFTILIISINMIIPILAPYLKEWNTIVANNKLPLRHLLSMIYPVFSVPIFIFYFLYHMLKIAEAKAVIAANGIPARGYESGADRSEDTTLDKCHELYDCIVEYFENEKPYLDPNFSISQLSIRLKSNNSYMSKAIKLKRNMSFTSFVNTYRVERVKEMIRNSRDMYTIEYIYTSAGFANQSTFNKAFKQLEGVTPSEYAAK